MAKTELILTQNVVGLGAESDHVKVSAGYARNYLLPHGLAIPVTGANKRRLEVLRQRRAEREAHEFNTMNELGQSLSKMRLVITVKTGEDGKMFGSVTGGTIADELKHQFEVSLDKRKIHLVQPIKKLGEYDIELRLHPDVVTSLKVRVDSSTPLAAPAEAPAGPAPARESAQGKQGAQERGAAAKGDGKKERTEKRPKASRPKKTE